MQHIEKIHENTEEWVREREKKGEKDRDRRRRPNQ